MANKKISELPIASALTGSESIEVVQGGANSKTTAQAIANLAAAAGSFSALTGQPTDNANLATALNLKADALVTFATKIASHTLDATDLAAVNAGDRYFILMNVGSANNLTVPPNATQAFPVGTEITIDQIGAGLTTVVAGVGVTITGSAGNLDSPGQYGVMVLIKTATNTWSLKNGIAGGGSETTTTIGALIDSATAKATPVDADMIGLMDSAASNILKKLSWANVKATLKTYFDTIYQPLDATLTALAGLATGASKVPYSTGVDTFGQLDLDTDGTLAANSDTRLATQKAVKTYADAAVPAAHVTMATALTTLTNMTLAADNITGSIRYSAYFDATKFNYIRLAGQVNSASSSANTPVLYMRYSTDDGSNWTSIGDETTAGQVINIASGGLKKTDWLALPAGAKADVLFGPWGKGGDGVADPILGALYFQFKK